MNKYILISLVLVCSCSTQPRPPKNHSFVNTHLLFDQDQEIERYECKVTGNIPQWLSGTLLRNGPAKFTAGENRVDWFDGLGMLLAFEFNPNQVFFSNKFLRSEQYYTMMVEKSTNFFGFANDPCNQVFKDQKSHYIPPEMQGIANANVTIQEYADKMVALTEVPLPVVFDPSTVATKGNFQYQDSLEQGQWESAHCHHDFKAKETVNYFIRFGEQTSYVIWKMKDHSSKREVIAEIPVRTPSYMHTFALTENYVILVEYPFVVDPIDLMTAEKAFIANYKWKPELGTKFLVVNRHTGLTVTEIKTDPFFAFHHVNAFDKNGKITMDIVTYQNADVIIKDLPNKRKLQRFVIDLSTNRLAKETIFNQNLEMPRIADHYDAQEYRYCYAIDSRFPRNTTDRRPLYKIDTKTKLANVWTGEGCYPGEPIFVPKPNARSEDEGVVLSVVLDMVNQKTFLLVLDAYTWTELARAEAPYAIPVGLHGLFKSFPVQ